MVGGSVALVRKRNGPVEEDIPIYHFPLDIALHVPRPQSCFSFRVNDQRGSQKTDAYEVSS